MSDGYEMTNYFAFVRFDTQLRFVYHPLPSKLVAKEGEEFNYNAQAKSSATEDVEFKWYKMDEETGKCELVSSSSELFIKSVSENDYFKKYICAIYDGYEYQERTVKIVPYMDVNISISDIVVVEEENIVIKGSAQALKTEKYEDERNFDFPDVRVGKYDPPFVDEYGDTLYKMHDMTFRINGEELDWQDFVDGTALKKYTETETETAYQVDFEFTIPKISKDWEGEFFFSARGGFGATIYADFSISVGEYGDMKITTDEGTSIEGFLHPAQK